MVQAIKDLANAFVPSGRLIELVDITLVRGLFSFSEPLFYCSERLRATFSSPLPSASDG